MLLLWLRCIQTPGSRSAETSDGCSTTTGAKRKKRRKTTSVSKCNAECDDVDMTITHIETTYITVEDPAVAKRKLAAEADCLDEEMQCEDEAFSGCIEGAETEECGDETECMDVDCAETTDEQEDCIVLSPDHPTAPIFNMKSSIAKTEVKPTTEAKNAQEAKLKEEEQREEKEQEEEEERRQARRAVLTAQFAAMGKGVHFRERHPGHSQFWRERHVSL